LKVRNITFFSWAKHIIGHFTEFFEGTPSKNPKKCPMICFAPDKKIISRTFKIRGTLVFLCPEERERARVRERVRARAGARARARARVGKGGKVKETG
jgi:hypothetical protein